MGRAPCCDKANVKKGPWSPEEDAKLKAYIQQHGTGGNWIALPQKIGLKRCGKSCRLRWLNYLRPNIKHGGFSEEEDNIICSLYVSIGSRWSIIAAQLPGRTDNDIKNYWNTRLKKKLLGKQRKEQQAQRPSRMKAAMKRESGNLMAPGAMNLYPYWPELPMALAVANQCQDYSNVKDQESLKALLIKLGGRFSEDYQMLNIANTSNFQCPLNVSSTQDYLYNSINMIAPSTTMNSIDSTSPELSNTQYVNSGAGFDILQELDNYPVELNDTRSQYPQQSEGPESISGVQMVNESKSNITSPESASWEDISSLVCPPILSNYDVC